MNVFLFELKSIRKSLITWSLSISAFLVFYLSFFPLMESSGGSFDQIMANFPPEFTAFFGMSPELPISTIMGYFALTFGIVQIPLAIQASNYGFHILSVEERELTADFLFSKPIKRSTILYSKLGAITISLTVVNVLLFISTLICLTLFRAGTTVDYLAVVTVLSSIFFFQLFFVGVGMVISVSLKKIPSVLSFSMALSLGMYMASSLDTMMSMQIMKYVSPFSMFSPTRILIDGHLNLISLLICIVVIFGTILTSYFLYLKRNIASL
ncbi:MAG: ABC transporter permease subunit [Bacilli bacterium]|nr:ABC transporter permease subunit [Bacilli bacterium]